VHLAAAVLAGLLAWRQKAAGANELQSSTFKLTVFLHLQSRVCSMSVWSGPVLHNMWLNNLDCVDGGVQQANATLSNDS